MISWIFGVFMIQPPVNGYGSGTVVIIAHGNTGCIARVD
jgi:hypothetical protein